MQLIEKKNLILVKPSPDTEYRECNLIVTVPITFVIDMRSSIHFDNIDAISVDSTTSIKDSDIYYCPRMLKIFQYIGFEKKLLKLHRACDIDKHQCSEFILNQLSFILGNEYKDVLGVWTLPNVTDEMWANYPLFYGNKRVLPEQKLLKKASDLLNTKLKELASNLKAFHDKNQKKKSKKDSSDSLKDVVGS